MGTFLWWINQIIIKIKITEDNVSAVDSKYGFVYGMSTPLNKCDTKRELILTSVQVQTACMTANEGPYYSFLYSCDMLYYWFRWHDGQGISSNVCTGAVPDQPLHYESQTAKLIFFYMPCLSEIIKCLGGMPSIFSSPRVCGVFASAAACAILLFFFRQNDHKHLSNTNLLCMDINYTGRGTLSI